MRQQLLIRPIWSFSFLLGSAMFMMAPMLSLLAQLEILDDFIAISKELMTFSTNHEFEGPFSHLDYSTMEAVYVYLLFV